MGAPEDYETAHGILAEGLKLRERLLDEPSEIAGSKGNGENLVGVDLVSLVELRFGMPFTASEIGRAHV